MSGRRSLVWLGLTPEPERELPSNVAALRSPPTASAVEYRRVQRLILHGSERSWLRYLAEVTELVTGVATGTRPGDRRAALLAAEVVLDHHRMLIGLPGSAYARTARQRDALESALHSLRTGDADAAGRADDAGGTGHGSDVSRARRARGAHGSGDTARSHDATSHLGGHA
ncbi:hypothetical protein DB35_24340 [Streptomyces abyssalis]|uniref:Uncharacterized protein n=1 Tax=Streptomyces abyssalis TaxID=933944 RepID=A0A1E7JNL4_9ACTN|nr:hypothetical protein [Streptomyces abyssalis]OEU86769.1 hypothetical protein DB35_24340 [Streptomyces abyssalis]OEU89843.1 hypothetical protein AN215_09205 [Streptomyces abyssalis]